MNKIMLMVVIAGLTGCAGIDQPVAKVALVAPSLHKTAVVPALMVEVLEGEATNAVTDSSASAVFYSARGQSCRFISGKMVRQLYCQRADGEWFAVPAVLSDMQALKQRDGNDSFR